MFQTHPRGINRDDKKMYNRTRVVYVKIPLFLLLLNINLVGYILLASSVSSTQLFTEGDPSSWDILNEEFSEGLAGWTRIGSGRSYTTHLGYLYQKPDQDKMVGQLRRLGDLPESGYTLEFRLKVDSFDEHHGIFEVKLWDGVHFINIGISPKAVEEYGSGQSHPLSTDGDWHTWRFVIYSICSTIKIYRDAVFIVNWTKPLLNSNYNDGDVQVITRYHLGKTESRLDFIRIVKGLYVPKSPWKVGYPPIWDIVDEQWDEMSPIWEKEGKGVSRIIEGQLYNRPDPAQEVWRSGNLSGCLLYTSPSPRDRG